GGLLAAVYTEPTPSPSRHSSKRRLFLSWFFVLPRNPLTPSLSPNGGEGGRRPGEGASRGCARRDQSPGRSLHGKIRGDWRGPGKKPCPLAPGCPTKSRRRSRQALWTRHPSTFENPPCARGYKTSSSAGWIE